MRGNGKRAPLVVARGVAARLLVDRLGMHPAKIADMLDRDRSTIIHATAPRSVETIRRIMSEALEVAARLDARDVDDEAVLLELAADHAARCSAALRAAERRLDKRERGEAKRTSPERHHSPGALTEAAEEAATDGRQ